MPTQPGAARAVDGELDAGAPRQPTDVTGHGLDLDVLVEAGQPAQLLAHHLGLEPALRGEVDVLEVAAAARAGPGPRARRLDPVGRGGVDPDRVGPHEACPGPHLGDPGQHPLPRERVPDEEDLAVGARDPVPPVRERGDLDLDLVADGQARPLGRGHRSPRRTSPTTGPSIRSSAPSEDASCHGTDDTMTPGVKRRRVRSRSALWLCRICSHQWPTTYCGM